MRVIKKEKLSNGEIKVDVGFTIDGLDYEMEGFVTSAGFEWAKYELEGLSRLIASKARKIVLEDQKQQRIEAIKKELELLEKS